ncbi:hypothetical protein Pfo_008194 [Paulownia fortunei]|nr:hypothetical protein Pfo_008194 [Paulownia fortunei]
MRSLAYPTSFSFKIHFLALKLTLESLYLNPRLTNLASHFTFLRFSSITLRVFFLGLSVRLPLRACIAQQMSFDSSKKHQWFVWCAFCFMNRGRLWCSRKELFRHWT